MAPPRRSPRVSALAERDPNLPTKRRLPVTTDDDDFQRGKRSKVAGGDHEEDEEYKQEPDPESESDWEDEDEELDTDTHRCPEPDEYVVDGEDSEEDDPPEDSPYAEELAQFLKAGQQRDHEFFKTMTMDELRERVLRYEDRIEGILESLQETARSIPWEVIDDPEQSNPMTRAWWHFLTYMSVKKVVDMLLKSTATKVAIILGGPLTEEELLLLPSNWEGLSLWGVYLDILTGKVIHNAVEMELYTGSGTAKDGMSKRMETYPKVKAGTNNSEKGAHGKLIRTTGVSINLRVVAVFDPSKTPRPYVMLSEAIHTILLRSWDENVENTYLNKACAVAMSLATPEDLLPKQWTGLNRASQLLQGLFGSRKGRKCANCQTEESKSGWFYAEPGMAFLAVICFNCWRYKWRFGKTRPPIKEETWHAIQQAKKATPMPEDGLCQRIGCDRPIASPGHFNMGLCIWTCEFAACRQAIIREKVDVAKQFGHGDKPADGVCQRTNCDGKATKWNKFLQLWTCKNCSKTKSLVKTGAPAKTAYAMPNPGTCMRHDCNKPTRYYSKILNVWVCMGCKQKKYM